MLNSDSFFLIFKSILITLSVFHFGLFFSLNNFYFLWASFLYLLLFFSLLPELFWFSLGLFAFQFLMGWRFRYKIFTIQYQIKFFTFLFLTLVELFAIKTQNNLLIFTSIIFFVLILGWQNIVKLRQMYDLLERSRRETMETTTRLVASLKKNEKLLELKILERTSELQDAMLKITETNNNLVLANQEKNAFLGIVAHDLKNPISSVQMMIIYILKYLNPDQEITIRLNKILIPIERMFHILKNLLDLNMLETGQFKYNLENVDAHSLVVQMCDEYKERFLSKDITINLVSKLGNVSSTINVDRNFFIEILDNLISNALKYSAIGSTVIIYIEIINQNLVIKIKDSGPGISIEDQKLLFNKFTKLHAIPTANEHSSGLGLYIVKLLSMGMGGQIYCESTLGSGASFLLEFPVIKNP